MRDLIVVLDSRVQWKAYLETETLVQVTDYLRNAWLGRESILVLNLSGNLLHHTEGYYCSLLAQARDHRVLPDVEVINRLLAGALPRLEMPLQRSVQRWMKDASPDRPPDSPPEDQVVNIYFGQTFVPGLDKVARRIFEQFPCPLLQVGFSATGNGQVDSMRFLQLDELNADEEDDFATALDQFSAKVWRQPKAPRRYRYDLAVLHDPDEKIPPSNRGALQQFISQGKKMGMNVELLTSRESARLLEYDALFIRQTTALNHPTYHLSQQAWQANMPVIDDPMSIIRCTNKVYLKELFDREAIPAPKTRMIFRSSPMSFDEVVEELGLPVVLKLPDSAFSVGVIKIQTEEDYQKAVTGLFERASIILAQEYIFTDYDWRIGILNQQVLYACKYFMARGHWQIYQHQESGRFSSGGFETVPVLQAPKEVLKAARRAAQFIGNGLYGVDVKFMDGQCWVIEVNDNPSIDLGVEDHILGTELYRIILNEFIRRIDSEG